MTYLDDVARIGGAGTGVTRFAWTPELAEASAWLCERLSGLGLEPSIDAAGNVLGKWPTGKGKAVLVGSHLDTVPTGGRYDGALGVCSALEAVRLLQERGIEPTRPIWIVSFMDEEGARFRASLMGSRAFCGEDVSGLDERVDPDGVTLRAAMSALGYDYDRVGDARAVGDVGAYLELHIEQGPGLVEAGIDIGVVTGIVGLVGYRARFEGEANHAGTTPMRARRDAFAGGARTALALRERARTSGDLTVNVGVVRVEPGGFNVIPGACEITIDIRSAVPERYQELDTIVRDTAATIASEEKLAVEVVETHRLDPCPMDRALVEALERAVAAEGASSTRMPSGAGHDAMTLGRHVPSAMLFVPSQNGISHSPEEYSTPEDCERGARVLARALEELVT
jgi:hydantoinase/carbamoylase family amidase